MSWLQTSGSPDFAKMEVLLSVLVAVLTVLVAADAANSKVPVKSAKATRGKNTTKDSNL